MSRKRERHGAAWLGGMELGTIAGRLGRENGRGRPEKVRARVERGNNVFGGIRVEGNRGSCGPKKKKRMEVSRGEACGVDGDTGKGWSTNSRPRLRGTYANTICRRRHPSCGPTFVFAARFPNRTRCNILMGAYRKRRTRAVFPSARLSTFIRKTTDGSRNDFSRPSKQKFDWHGHCVLRRSNKIIIVQTTRAFEIPTSRVVPGP